MEDLLFVTAHGNDLAFAGLEGYRHLYCTSLVFCEQGSFNGISGEIVQSGLNCQPGFVQGFKVYLGFDCDIRYGHGTGLQYSDFTEDPHAFIDRAGVPVHETYIRFAWLCPEHLHGEDIVFTHIFGHIYEMTAECSVQVVSVGNLLAVQPDIGPVTDTVKYQLGMLAVFQGRHPELFPVPPRTVEEGLVYFLVVQTFQSICVDSVPGKGSHYGRRNHCIVPAFCVGSGRGYFLTGQISRCG